MAIENLNEMQRQAVLMLDRPLCILAGAGTGKTRVITHRIAYLVEQVSVEPRSIMGVTFTNKAAQEMRERIHRLLPSGAERIQLGTFHGLGARWLRRLGHFVGVSPSFLIYDEDDAYRLQKQIASEELHIPKETLDLYSKRIEGWQNAGLGPLQIIPGDDAIEQKAHALYRAYARKLEQSNALDFNSILSKWKELLENPQAFEIFKNEVKHLLVDEYQDTNVVQTQIVLKIASVASSVAVVGDDDQSIYGWRGAKANHLQKFIDQMNNARLVKLEQNYRSTRNILDAANQLISHNEGRIGKTLFTQADGGERVRAVRSRSDRFEAERIVDMIRADVSRGADASTIAVLMRTNGQSRLFEESLRRIRMPFKLIGGTKFYDRREIKDVLATLRVALNPKSDVDFLRALNAISRGVGESSLEKARTFAQANDLSLMELCSQVGYLSQCGLTKRAQQGLSDFATRLKELGEVCDRLDAEEAVVDAVQISGLADKLGQSDASEDAERLENIGQLVVSARQFVEEAHRKHEPAGPLHFLETSALMSSSDESTGSQGLFSGAITLMTLHAAKGLEFDYVFLVGLEEYGFPHARALAEDADSGELEEERRLAYVGMTRARKRLILSYADQRMVHGSVKPRMPSRFLTEIPKSMLDGELPYKPNSSAGVVKDRFSDISLELDVEYRVTQENSDFKKGTRVSHASFGKGTILECRGSGALLRALVRFDQDRRERAIVTTHLQRLNETLRPY